MHIAAELEPEIELPGCIGLLAGDGISLGQKADGNTAQSVAGVHRVQQLAGPEAGHDHKKLSLYSADYEELSKEILVEERQTILNLRNERVINDHVLRRIQRDVVNSTRTMR